MAVAIERLSVPATLDGPEGADFVAAIDVRNAAEVAGYGTPDVAYPAAELFPSWNDPNEPKTLWVARVDGRIVARCVHEWQLDDETVGWLTLHVHPDFRRAGSAAPWPTRSRTTPAHSAAPG